MKEKCPNDSALIRLFMSELGSLDEEKLLRHLASCSRCTLRFGILRHIKRDLQPEVDLFIDAYGADHAASVLRNAALQKIQGPDPRSSHQPLRSRPFGALFTIRFAVGFMAVLGVVMGVAYLTLARYQGHSELRSPSARLILLAPVGTVSVTPGNFRWTPVINAEGYSLDLIDDTLNRVHTLSTFLITEAKLPEAVRAKLVKGRPYVWSVSARDGDGNTLASKSGSFTIK